MENKLFEIRDKATCVPVLAIRVSGEDGYLMRRAGFQSPMVYLVHLTSERCKFWDTLVNGQVVDIEFILGETTESKMSEEVRHPV